MDVDRELDHLKLDDAALGINKLQVVCRIPGTMLGVKGLCSLKRVIWKLYGPTTSGVRDVLKPLVKQV
jgi:hypothetical protein